MMLLKMSNKCVFYQRSFVSLCPSFSSLGDESLELCGEGGLLSVTPIPRYFFQPFNAFLHGDNYGDDPGFGFQPGPWKDDFIPFEAGMEKRKGFGYVLLSWCPCHSAESCR